jgi:hydrogenase/urease accessory protein HupE
VGELLGIADFRTSERDRTKELTAMLSSTFSIIEPALRRGWLMAGILFTLLSATSVHAHEIGTNRVSVVFENNGSYQIEVVTDAMALIDKLEASTGSRSPQDTSAANLQALLPSFDSQFRQRVKIAFDGAETRPEISYFVASGTGMGASSVATIRLTGQAPAGAKHFTWTYSWTFASYAMTVRSVASRNPATQWLEGGQTSAPFALAVPGLQIDRLATALRYLKLGFTHILPNGLDHMLFVLGIFFLSGRARSVLAQVSAFTVAHSITLGLSMYGLVNVSPRIVEPAIALSIAYVAIENIVLSELKSWRLALVFAFGLLHGMGFAGALKELGLPRSEFVRALVTFNLGVEAGQLAVIGAAFLLVGWTFSKQTWYRSRVVVPASAAIAGMAVYWTIVRLAV